MSRGVRLTLMTGADRRCNLGFVWLRALIAGAMWAIAIIAAPAAAADPVTYPDSDANGVPMNRSGGPVPTMNGIPCVGGHYGVCFSFAQNQPVPKKPQATVGHSPTVTN